MKRTIKPITYILSAIILNTLTFTHSVAADDKKDAQQPPIPVVTTPALIKTVTDEVEALGTLSANESVNITATVTETISAIHFEDGQRVEQGDPLVEMTSGEEHAQIAEMRSTLNEAKSQYKRAQELVRDHTLSQATVDERKRNYETAKAQLVAMESRLKDRLILAPFSGVLGLRQVSIGTLVQPATLITTIDDDHVMKCDFSIPSAYLASVKAGLEIAATSDAYPERTFSGKLVAVDSRIDEATRMIRARATIPNPDGALRSGLTMTIHLLGTPRTALLIPEAAIVPLGSEHFVYVASAADAKGIRTAKKTKIALKARHGAFAEISSGLKQGDEVISEGTMMLTDGKSISIKQPSSETPQPQGKQ
jgi:membrane fusion protein (multidrug efflux system)